MCVYFVNLWNMCDVIHKNTDECLYILHSLLFLIMLSRTLFIMLKSYNFTILLSSSFSTIFCIPFFNMFHNKTTMKTIHLKWEDNHISSQNHKYTTTIANSNNQTSSKSSKTKQLIVEIVACRRMVCNIMFMTRKVIPLLCINDLSYNYRVLFCFVRMYFFLYVNSQYLAHKKYIFSNSRWNQYNKFKII